MVMHLPNVGERLASGKTSRLWGGEVAVGKHCGEFFPFPKASTWADWTVFAEVTTNCCHVPVINNLYKDSPTSLYTTIGKGE